MINKNGIARHDVGLCKHVAIKNGHYRNAGITVMLAHSHVHLT